MTPEELERLLAETAAARYGGRDPAMVAVHELLHPATELPRLRSRGEPEPNGFLVVGELVERGLRSLLAAEEPPRVDVDIDVTTAEPPPTVADALEAAGVKLRRRGGRLYLTVTGQTDLLVHGDPAARLWEVKTTRSSRWKAYKSKWVAQAKLYSALYGEPVRLVVVNINASSGFIQTFVYEEPREYLTRIVRRWLRGEPFPWA